MTVNWYALGPVNEQLRFESDQAIRGCFGSAIKFPKSNVRGEGWEVNGLTVG